MGENSLREVSVPIEKIDDELKDFVSEMFETVKRENGVGLAAPQVGRNIRLFIVDLNNEQLVFINPQIIATSQELSIMEEGCLSIPKIYEKVERPTSIRVQFMNLDGKIKTVDASDLFARVIQHENDHLNGVLFVDRLDEETRNNAVKRFEKKTALSKKHFIRKKR